MWTAALIAATVMLASGCELLIWETVRGSGAIASREIELGDVTEVHIGSALEAEIVPGERARVTVRADDNVHDHLDISERAGEVVIRVERAVRLRDATIEITVELPAVSRVRTSGAAGIELADGLDADDLELLASGSSELRGSVTAGRVEISASGSSDVALAGSAEALAVHASGSSTAVLHDLVVTGDGEVRASGSSDVTVHVEGALNARASGASDIRYRGHPTAVTAESSGASTIESDT